MTDNANIKEYLVSNYNAKAFTHSYIFGYVEAGMVYAAFVDNGSDLLPYITYLDRASQKNGGSYALKYRPNASQRALIVSKATMVKAICTEDRLETLKATTKHNRGQLFENLVAEAVGARLEKKPNLKFTEGPDMWYEGIPYQAKFPKATFTDEKTLANL